MSCGRPHATPCAEVIAHLYEYLDNELPDGDCVRIRAHLEECGPCLREYGIEEAVKALVKRSCCQVAPEQLRARVLLTIRQVSVDVRRVDEF